MQPKSANPWQSPTSVPPVPTPLTTASTHPPGIWVMISLGGLVPMGGGVVGVGELERAKAAALGGLALGAGQGAADSLGARREDDCRRRTSR